MQHLLIMIAMTILAACAANTTSGQSSSPDKTQTMVLKCSHGLVKCYSSANDICGSRGFDELDRAHGGQLTATGRLEDQGDGRHVYQEDVRFEQDQQTIVIRCK